MTFGSTRIEVQHFFEIYKELEGNAVELKGWKDVDEAQAAIRQSRERYLNSGKTPASA